MHLDQHLHVRARQSARRARSMNANVSGSHERRRAGASSPRSPTASSRTMRDPAAASWSSIPDEVLRRAGVAATSMSICLPVNVVHTSRFVPSPKRERGERQRRAAAGRSRRARPRSAPSGKTRSKVRNIPAYGDARPPTSQSTNARRVGRDVVDDQIDHDVAVGGEARRRRPRCRGAGRRRCGRSGRTRRRRRRIGAKNGRTWTPPNTPLSGHRRAAGQAGEVTGQAVGVGDQLHGVVHVRSSARVLKPLASGFLGILPRPGPPPHRLRITDLQLSEKSGYFTRSSRRRSTTPSWTWTPFTLLAEVRMSSRVRPTLPPLFLLTASAAVPATKGAAIDVPLQVP